MPRPLEIGDHVRHKRYGIGTIKKRWGAWFSCRECNLDMAKHQPECPRCKKATILLAVNGRDIFDVQFGKEIKPRAIHQHWLKKIKTDL